MESSVSIDNKTLVEASQMEDDRQPVLRLVLVMAAILLMILPFVTTFNEFLTRLVETVGLNTLLAEWVVPLEVRMVSASLALVGIKSQVSATTVYLEKGSYFLPVYIAWNCVGWQSFILYAGTLVTGMQGPFSRMSKFETLVVGLLGTYLVNLFRITSVALVAFWFGHVPAVIYHDYGGTVLILIWLFAFWWFSHGWLLEPLSEMPDDERPQEPYLKDIYSSEGQRPSVLRRWFGQGRRA